MPLFQANKADGGRKAGGAGKKVTVTTSRAGGAKKGDCHLFSNALELVQEPFLAEIGARNLFGWKWCQEPFTFFGWELVPGTFGAREMVPGTFWRGEKR